jgi:hypothetical protein
MSPAPIANAAAATTRPYNDLLSVVDEIIDLRRAHLVLCQGHSFRLIRHDGGAEGNCCSTAAKYYSTAQDTPQDAAAICFVHWIAPHSNLQACTIIPLLTSLDFSLTNIAPHVPADSRRSDEAKSAIRLGSRRTMIRAA